GARAARMQAFLVERKQVAAEGVAARGTSSAVRLRCSAMPGLGRRAAPAVQRSRALERRTAAAARLARASGEPLASVRRQRLTWCDPVAARTLLRHRLRAGVQPWHVD